MNDIEKAHNLYYVKSCVAIIHDMLTDNLISCSKGPESVLRSGHSLSRVSVSQLGPEFVSASRVLSAPLWSDQIKLQLIHFSVCLNGLFRCYAIESRCIARKLSLISFKVILLIIGPDTELIEH